MLILSPLPIAAVTAGAENLLTPSPREVWVAPGVGAYPIVLDMGAVVSVDTAFVGFTNAHAGSSWQVFTGPDMAGPWTATAMAGSFTPVGVMGARRHGFSKIPNPVASRYFQLRTESNGAPAMQYGIVMLGKAIILPHEYGSGRAPIDLGGKERLPDGGLGIDAGAIVARLQWRFVGLSDATTDQLWDLVANPVTGRGETKPVLVAETRAADLTDLAGRNDRLHYGTFDRIEPYSRRDPNDTVWSMAMTEWA